MLQLEAECDAHSGCREKSGIDRCDVRIVRLPVVGLCGHILQGCGPCVGRGGVVPPDRVVACVAGCAHESSQALARGAEGVPVAKDDAYAFDHGAARGRKLARFHLGSHA